MISVFAGRNNTHVYIVKAQQSYHENRIAFDFSFGSECMCVCVYIYCQLVLVERSGCLCVLCHTKYGDTLLHSVRLKMYVKLNFGLTEISKPVCIFAAVCRFQCARTSSNHSTLGSVPKIRTHNIKISAHTLCCIEWLAGGWNGKRCMQTPMRNNMKTIDAQTLLHFGAVSQVCVTAIYTPYFQENSLFRCGSAAAAANK